MKNCIYLNQHGYIDNICILSAFIVIDDDLDLYYLH